MSTKLAQPPDPITELCGQTPVTCLACGEKGSLNSTEHSFTLFSGHQNGKIIQWDVSTHRRLYSWDAHADGVLWMRMLEGRFLSQGRDGAVRIWTLSQTGWTLASEAPSASLIFCNSTICPAPDAGYLLAVPGDETSQINIFHLKQPSLSLSEAKFNTLPSSSIGNLGMCMRMKAFVTNTNIPKLLVGFESGYLCLWDLVSFELKCSIQAHEECIMGLDCWSSSAQNYIVRCVTGSVGTEVKSWKIEDDQIIVDNSLQVTNPGVNDIVIRADGKIVASAGWDSRGRVFSLSKLRPLVVLTYHKASVQCVTFCPDNTFATGSKDGYIALWDAYKNVTCER